MVRIPGQGADALSLAPFRTGTLLPDLGCDVQKCVALVRDRVLDRTT